MENASWYGSLRNRLKSSSIRRFYWGVVRRDVLAASRREERFYRDLLVGFQDGDLIFDIGANEGAKTDIFLRLGSRVVLVEPDAACQLVLHDRFLRKGIRTRRVQIVGKAVSSKVGAEEMWVDGPGSAVNSMSRKWVDYLKEHKDSFKWGHCGLEFESKVLVPTTTVDEMIELYGVPYFIKIDVEGHELDVLMGMRQPVPFVSFEVNLRSFRSEGVECVRVLDRLKAGGSFNYTADCCAGFTLGNWFRADAFCPLLRSCGDETVEVFWRSEATVG